MMMAWLGFCLAHRSANGESIHVREHHVEDDQVVVTLYGSLQTLGTILRALGPIAVKHEHIEKPMENGRIILDHEYTGFRFSVGCRHLVGTLPLR
jgi:hypothetical protein